MAVFKKLLAFSVGLGVPQVIYLSLVVCVRVLMQVMILWEVSILGVTGINFRSWPDLI